MVRPLRVEYEGAYYHVMSRGRGRQNIYHGKRYNQRFLECLEQAHRRFALECHAYCLMGNHYHLLVRTPRGNLSRAMRHVNGVYTQYYNRLKKTDGPLFRGRYKAINIEASDYLLQVSRYIHRNSVETKKPLVDRLDTYEWSSYPAYVGKVDCPDWLYTDSVLSECGSSYRRYVERGMDEETALFYEKDHWPVVRGSKDFVERAHLRSNANSKEVRRDRDVIGADVILATIAGHLECRRSDLLRARRGRGANNRGRLMAMKLCQELGSMKLSEMAELFEVGSDSAVSRSVSKFNELLSRDAEVRVIYDAICQDLIR